MMKYLCKKLSAHHHVGSPGGSSEVGYSFCYTSALSWLSLNISLLFFIIIINIEKKNDPADCQAPRHGLSGDPRGLGRRLSLLYPYTQTGRWRGLLMTLCVTSKQCNQTLQTWAQADTWHQISHSAALISADRQDGTEDYSLRASFLFFYFHFRPCNERRPRYFRNLCTLDFVTHERTK